MNVKLEVKSSDSIKDLNGKVERILSVVPAEHLRGLTKIVFVDQITEPRLSAAQRASLPALYHPKMPGQMAWAEVAMTVLAPKKKFPKESSDKTRVKIESGANHSFTNRSTLLPDALKRHKEEPTGNGVQALCRKEF